MRSEPCTEAKAPPKPSAPSHTRARHPAVTTKPQTSADGSEGPISAAGAICGGETGAPVIIATPKAVPPVRRRQPAPAKAQTPLEAAMSAEAPTQSDATMPEEPSKKTFWGKLFGDRSKEAAAENSKYMGEGLTPLPGNSGGEYTAPKPVVVPAAKPLEVVAPVPIFARYNYFSPHKPAPGDRTMANGAFTEARLFEQDWQRWSYALQSYQQAAALDPSWFEAQYNTGVIAHRLRNYSVALPRYEMALAIRPESDGCALQFCAGVSRRRVMRRTRRNNRN